MGPSVGPEWCGQFWRCLSGSPFSPAIRREENQSLDAGFLGEMRQAKAICMTCPVRQECLDYAVDSREDWGIWGGATPNQRRVLRKKVGFLR